MTVPYRPNQLEFPLTAQQVDGLDRTIEDIYDELRRLTSGTHQILSATHDDTEVETPENGDLLYYSGSWRRLGIGSNGSFLQVVTGAPAWGVNGALLEDLNASEITSGTLDPARLANSGAAAGTYGDATHVAQVTVDAKGRVTAAVDVLLSLPPTTHSFLSTTHPDTEPASPTIGDLVVAQNAGAIDVDKYFIDGGAFNYLPNANDPGAEAFWVDGLPASGLISSGAVKWARHARGTPGYVLTAGATGPSWQPAASGATLGAAVYRASDFSLADRTPTAVSHSTTVFDDGGFVIAASPTRLTVPTGAGGAYAIAGTASWDSGSVGSMFAYVYVNGVKKATSAPATSNSPAPYLDPASVSAVLKLAAGDYVELYLEHAANVPGTSYTIKGGAANTYLQMARLNSESVTATGLPTAVAGNIIQGNPGSTAYDRLALGAANSVLISSGGAAAWSARPTLRDVAESITSQWQFTNGFKEWGRSVALGVGTDVAYNAGDYDTNDAAATLTVDAGDVTTFKYWMVGSKLMFISIALSAMSLSGTTVATTQIRVKLPGGATSSGSFNTTQLCIDNGSPQEIGDIVIAVSGTKMLFRRSGLVRWNNSVNATYVNWVGFIEIV